MRAVIIVLALALTSGARCGRQAPDCNHGVVCGPNEACTFLQNPPGSGTGEWHCVTTAPVNPTR